MTYPTNEIDLETPEIDAAEQATTIPGWQDDEADETDGQEQDRIVAFDDDYR
ncbi:hypothetical protein [Actinoplanes subglobosus]|uniref:Uncharacterized protein n=1 Tax=Actinoplanes subglobosus TaxID=1547892 RepID=A0ABV8IQB2_9ACTN